MKNFKWKQYLYVIPEILLWVFLGIGVTLLGRYWNIKIAGTVGWLIMIKACVIVMLKDIQDE